MGKSMIHVNIKLKNETVFDALYYAFTSDTLKIVHCTMFCPIYYVSVFHNLINDCHYKIISTGFPTSYVVVLFCSVI
jgi:hypothetical protein